MTSIWRSVRVFISSTFRDMHAERDHLVKVVFPALRERLEKHRIHLIDIDLRWGVTREQAENDQVLGLCLQQIDECRYISAHPSSRIWVGRIGEYVCLFALEGHDAAQRTREKLGKKRTELD